MVARHIPLLRALLAPPFLMLELDKIHTTDCFSATTQIPNDGVDAVITDPPYPNRMNLFDESLVDGLAMLYLACKKAKKYVVFFWNPFDVPPPPAGWHEVARHVWKYFPNYGNEQEVSAGQGDDRPIPYELKDRINSWLEKQRLENPLALKRRLEEASIFNAVVRLEIHAGRI